MQSVYEWEFRNGSLSLDEITERNIEEFKKEADSEYVWGVVRGCAEHMSEIKALIGEAAPEWPIEQIARVDKSILTVAIYEMLFDASEDVPPRVSINEAIEVGKTFGSETSSKFINGVLGYIYRHHEDRLKPRDER